MGTNCLISKQLGDDTYKTIFCQLDGYPDFTGALLTKYYNTPEQVDALLALGDIYYLGSKLNPDANNPHNLDDGTQKGVTVAFARDCGGVGYDASIKNIEEMLEDDFTEYIYIFTQDNRWKYIACLAEEMEVKDVAETLENGEQEMQDPNIPYAWIKDELRKFLTTNSEDETLTMEM